VAHRPDLGRRRGCRGHPAGPAPMTAPPTRVAGLDTPRKQRRTRHIVAALGWQEARRMLRSPFILVGLVLCGLFAWSAISEQENWSGARYTSAPILLSPLLLLISVVVSASFHREWSAVSSEAPVGESLRAAGRLLGAFALVVMVAVLVVGGATYFRVTGGLDLGDEPGRTLHAHFTLPELLQQVSLAVLAVAAGAAAGRRMRHRASATLVLFVGWFPVGFVSWAFQGPHVVPFSIIQIQPVNVYAAPGDADPLKLPTSWLLSSPGEYQEFWGRQFASAHLAA
jgi:hypothetical protein